MGMIDLGDGGDGIIKPLVILVFFALFGYAYCASASAEVEDSPENDDLDPNNLKNKDVTIVRKLAEEIKREKERVAKVEEHLKRFEPVLPAWPNAPKSKSDLTDDSKNDAAPK